MSNLELTALPETFPAGTTVSYLKGFTEYPPAAGWGLRLYLRGPGALDVVATVEGTSFRVVLTATATTDLPAGTYQWEERVTKGTDVLVAATGTITVTPNLVAAAEGDLTAWAEKTLVLVEQAIAGRLPSGMDSYQIAGRAISKIPLKELFGLRAQLETMVTHVQTPGSMSRPILIKFTSPQ